MRKRYSAAFKAHIVQELLRGEKTIAQLAAAHIAMPASRAGMDDSIAKTRAAGRPV